MFLESGKELYPEHDWRGLSFQRAVTVWATLVSRLGHASGASEFLNQSCRSTAEGII